MNVYIITRNPLWLLPYQITAFKKFGAKNIWVVHHPKMGARQRAIIKRLNVEEIMLEDMRGLSPYESILYNFVYKAENTLGS